MSNARKKPTRNPRQEAFPGSGRYNGTTPVRALAQLARWQRTKRYGWDRR